MSHLPYIVRFAVVILLLIASVCTCISEADAGVNEEDLRAAYLFNFASLVDWPTTALPATATQLTLCHIGQDDAANGRGIDALARLGGRKVNDREIVFKRVQAIGEMKTCQIAFIGELDKSTANKLSDALRFNSVLTVAMERDITGSTRDIAILLAIDVDRMVFQINDDYAKRTGLVFSSKLMRLAKK